MNNQSKYQRNGYCWKKYNQCRICKIKFKENDRIYSHDITAYSNRCIFSKTLYTFCEQCEKSSIEIMIEKFKSMKIFRKSMIKQFNKIKKKAIT